MKENKKGSYAFDKQLLFNYLKPIELSSVDGRSKLITVPEYQGRVMTSTAEGDDGFSFGWINHELIKSGELQKKINAYGGEERMWMGPEGGQFSIFFEKDKPFTFDYWQTPACMDTDVYNVVEQNADSVSFEKEVELGNYFGSNLKFKIERKVSLKNIKEFCEEFEIENLASVSTVAFETDNQLTNIGDNAWTKESGALSIWMLGMYNPSPEVTVVIPYKKGDYGKVVNGDYFGEIPEDRLKTTDNGIFFKADGKFRSKIGVPPGRALPLLGSYDAENKILTIVKCTLDENATDYVNSAWELQEDPFSGDVINAYNDGPLEDGSQMGPFYELETSSKAGFLKPGETLQHKQMTSHFVGEESKLNEISLKVLGISINDIKKAI